MNEAKNAYTTSDSPVGECPNRRREARNGRADSVYSTGHSHQIFMAEDRPFFALSESQIQHPSVKNDQVEPTPNPDNDDDGDLAPVLRMVRMAEEKETRKRGQVPLTAKKTSASLPSLAQFSAHMHAAKQRPQNTHKSNPHSPSLPPPPVLALPSPPVLSSSVSRPSPSSRGVAGDISATSREHHAVSSRGVPSLRLSDIALKPMESTASYVGWVVKKNELPVAMRKKNVFYSNSF